MFPSDFLKNLGKTTEHASAAFAQLERVAAAVVENILLGNAGVRAEIGRRPAGKQLSHCPLHPHIQRKRLIASHP